MRRGNTHCTRNAKVWEYSGPNLAHQVRIVLYVTSIPRSAMSSPIFLVTTGVDVRSEDHPDSGGLCRNQECRPHPIGGTVAGVAGRCIADNVGVAGI